MKKKKKTPLKDASATEPALNRLVSTLSFQGAFMATQAHLRLTAQLFKVHFKVLKRDVEARRL